MGPTIEICSRRKVDDQLLLSVDVLLHAECDSVRTTRKGKVFDVYVEDRPFHAWILGAEDSPESLPTGMSSAICISAGCNQSIDGEILQRLAERVALEFDGEIGTIEH